LDRLREKIKIVFFLVLLVSKVGLVGQSEPHVNLLILTICLIFNSSISQYHKLENKILELKKKFGFQGAKTKKHANLLFYLEHIFPFIFWQTLVLFLLILFVLFFLFCEKRKLPLFTMIVFFISLVAIFVGYRNRCAKWYVVENSGECLRLGPGEKYPIRVKLKKLNELKIKQIVKINK